MSFEWQLIMALLLGAGLLHLVWRLLSRQLGEHRTRLYFAAVSLVLVSVANAIAAQELLVTFGPSWTVD